MPVLSVSESWRAPLYCLSVVGVMVRFSLEVIDIFAKRKIQPQYEIEDLEEDLKALEND
ncbi:unnamed protein product [marine sediment metagenome]|uniref:Uncharacterized protein n=1 Tax=marine sediment metagenome TaxID=412755 RepID=X1KIG3_9ZZZZ